MKARTIPCLHQPPTRGDNSFGSSRRYCHSWCYQAAFATGLGIKRNIYIYIYMPDQLRAETTLDINLFLLVCSLWFKKQTNKKRVYFRPLILLRVYSNRFLRNHTGIVVPHVFPSCWKLLAFDQIQLNAYCAAVWRRFEATFKLRPVIPIFERNEITECSIKSRQPTSIGIT